MDKQKQIEEMAKVMLEEAMKGYPIATSAFTDTKLRESFYPIFVMYAEALHNAGYRKIPENAVAMTREEYENLQKGIKTYNYTAMFDAQSAYRWERGYLQGTKETAEKFAERLKAKLNEWLEDNEDLNGKIDFGIASIELIGVKSLDGEVIAESLIDEICKEITEG